MNDWDAAATVLSCDVATSHTRTHHNLIVCIQYILYTAMVHVISALVNHLVYIVMIFN